MKTCHRQRPECLLSRRHTKQPPLCMPTQLGHTSGGYGGHIMLLQTLGLSQPSTHSSGESILTLRPLPSEIHSCPGKKGGVQSQLDADTLRASNRVTQGSCFWLYRLHFSILTYTLHTPHPECHAL